MKEAGLTPMQILKSATATAAKTFGGDTGTQDRRHCAGQSCRSRHPELQPLEDIAHASDIQTVIKNGVFYPADSLAAALSDASLFASQYQSARLLPSLIDFVACRRLREPAFGG